MIESYPGIESEPFGPDNDLRVDYFGGIYFRGWNHCWTPSGPNLHLRICTTDPFDPYRDELSWKYDTKVMIMGDEPSADEYETEEEYERLCTEYFFDEMNGWYDGWIRRTFQDLLDHPEFVSKATYREIQKALGRIEASFNRKPVRQKTPQIRRKPVYKAKRRGY